MLSDKELEKLFDKLKTPKEGRAWIRRTRQGPSRRPQSTSESGCVRFCSQKMGWVIHGESRTLEFPNIMFHETSPVVLEYGTQGETIHYSAPNSKGRLSGRSTKIDLWSTQEDGFYIQETKYRSELNRIFLKYPGLLVKDEHGNFRNPHLEKKFSEMGLKFIIKTEEDFDPILFANCQVLENYYVNPLDINKKMVKLIKSRIDKARGSTIEELLRFDDIDIDSIYQLIASGNLICPMDFRPVTDQSLFRVFASKNALNRFYESRSKVPEGILEDLELSTGMSILLSASDAVISKALHRYKVVQKFLSDGIIPDAIPKSTFYEWRAKYFKSEAIFGSGLPMLIDGDYCKGVRGIGSKTQPEIIEIIKKKKKTEYDNRTVKSKNHLYTKAIEGIKQAGYIPPSRELIYKLIDVLHDQKAKEVRDGHKVAHSEDCSHDSTLYDETKKGLFPGHVVHIDHTPIKLFVRGKYYRLFKTKKSKVKLWITTITDSYSRKVKAYFLSFKAPSVNSALMCLRRYLIKHGVAPKYIVCDGGKEFESVEFERFLARVHVHKIERRKGKAKDGSPVERSFLSIKTMLTDYLKGNSKALRNPRSTTPQTNPQYDAIWTLSDFDEQLEEFFEVFYNNRPHKGLYDATPNQIEADGARLVGEHVFRKIPSRSEIIFLTMARSRYESTKVIRGDLRVQFVDYHNADTRRSESAGLKYPTKWDMEDITYARAYIKGEWKKLTSLLVGLTTNMTPREIYHLGEEYRYVSRSCSEIEDEKTQLYIELLNNIDERERVLEREVKDNQKIQGEEKTQRTLLRKNKLGEAFGYNDYEPKSLWSD